MYHAESREGSVSHYYYLAIKVLRSEHSTQNRVVLLNELTGKQVKTHRGQAKEVKGRVVILQHGG